jgi:hypothetical protein
MVDPVAADMRIELDAVICVPALLRIAELLQSVPSVDSCIRANVSGADNKQQSEKGGGGEATQLEDRAGSDGASERRRRKRVGAVDGKRRGGGGERRQR